MLTEKQKKQIKVHLDKFQAGVVSFETIHLLLNYSWVQRLNLDPNHDIFNLFRESEKVSKELNLPVDPNNFNICVQGFELPFGCVGMIADDLEVKPLVGFLGAKTVQELVQVLRNTDDPQLMKIKASVLGDMNHTPACIFYPVLIRINESLEYDRAVYFPVANNVLTYVPLSIAAIAKVGMLDLHSRQPRFDGFGQFEQN